MAGAGEGNYDEGGNFSSGLGGVGNSNGGVGQGDHEDDEDSRSDSEPLGDLDRHIELSQTHSQNSNPVEVSQVSRAGFPHSQTVVINSAGVDEDERSILSFTDEKLDHDRIAMIIKRLRGDSLEELYLINVGLTDQIVIDMVTAVEKGRCFSQLKVLHLDNNGLTDKCAPALASLLSISDTLETLSIRGNLFTGCGIQLLSNGYSENLEESKLKELFLGDPYYKLYLRFGCSEIPEDLNQLEDFFVVIGGIGELVLQAFYVRKFGAYELIKISNMALLKIKLGDIAGKEALLSDKQVKDLFFPTGESTIDSKFDDVCRELTAHKIKLAPDVAPAPVEKALPDFSKYRQEKFNRSPAQQYVSEVSTTASGTAYEQSSARTGVTSPATSFSAGEVKVEDNATKSCSIFCCFRFNR